MARNTAAEADIASLEESLPAAKENLSSSKVLVTHFEAIDRADRFIRSKVTPFLAPYVTLDETVVPPKVEWSGESGYVRPDIEKGKEELSALEQAGGKLEEGGRRGGGTHESAFPGEGGVRHRYGLDGRVEGC